MTADNAELYRSAAGYERAMRHYDALLTRITVPYEMVRVPTRCGKTSVLIAGPEDAPPVVFWHGLGLMGPHWWQQINVIAQTYRVYAPDVVGGMGRSAATRPDTQGSAYGAWIDDVMDGLEIPQAHMVGISNGAWLIVRLATVAPERISSAVLMSIAGVAEPNWSTALRLLPTFLPFWSQSRRSRYFVQVMAPPGYQVSEEAATVMENFLFHFKYPQRPPPLIDGEIRCLTAPVHLMMGAYERSFDVQAVIERMQRVLPRLEQVSIVPDAGHGIISENPAWVNRSLLQWFRRL